MFSILLMPIFVFAGPIAEMQALGQKPAVYKKCKFHQSKMPTFSGPSTTFHFLALSPMSDLVEGWTPMRSYLKRSGSLAFDMYDSPLEGGW